MSLVWILKKACPIQKRVVQQSQDPVDTEEYKERDGAPEYQLSPTLMPMLISGSVYVLDKPPEEDNERNTREYRYHQVEYAKPARNDRGKVSKSAHISYMS